MENNENTGFYVLASSHRLWKPGPCKFRLVFAVFIEIQDKADFNEQYYSNALLFSMDLSEIRFH